MATDDRSSSATLRDASARSPFRQAGLHTTPPSQFRGVTRRAPSMHLAVAGASLMPRAAHDWQQLEARAARRGWPDYLAAWHHMDCDRCRWRSWGSASGPPRPPSWLADLDPDRANPLSCEPLKTETSPLALTLHLLSRSTSRHAVHDSAAERRVYLDSELRSPADDGVSVWPPCLGVRWSSFELIQDKREATGKTFSFSCV